MRSAFRAFACLPMFLMVLSLAAIGAETASAQTNVLFIVDSSGSMRAKVEGKETRMSVAKRALSLALKDMPKEARLGMMLYGHRRAKDCKDIELVSPIASEDAAALADRVEALQPRGETPIAAALELAARSFAAFKGQNNMIILVTDGIEECGGDPCAAARAIKAAGLNLKAHIVGFNLSAKQRAAIECVVKETGGTYFDARNARGLRDALQSVKKEIAQPTPPPEPPKPQRHNLLARKNGTVIVFSSTSDWSQSNDDVLKRFGSKVEGMRRGHEAVFSFRGGAAARFDGFAVYVGGASRENPKEIEILAGDEGPVGAFRSLGVVTVADGIVGDGWQEFKIPETTAKFFKVKLLSNHGGPLHFELFELALRGTLVGEVGKDTPAPPGPRFNLISQRNGGQVTAQDRHWPETIDDNIGRIGGELSGLKAGDEAVFSFRGGAAARLDTFAVYVEATSDRNPKEIEVLAGDEGPGGPFRSLGAFTLADGKLGDGWQEFKLPETTAKFFKVKLVSSRGGHRIYLYELRLYGELK